MKTHLFDDITRALTALPSRRDLLRSLAGAGLGFEALRFSETAAAKKKRKNKKKNKGKNERKEQAPQPVINRFGCAEVGQPCQGDSTLCCSGICEGVAPKKGKPDTRRCAAHGTGTCDQAAEGACTAPDPLRNHCDNNANCACIRTTAGSNFCARFGPSVTECADCQKDADCEALGFPAGSVCVPFDEGICAGACPGGTTCAAPCGAVPPES